MMVFSSTNQQEGYIYEIFLPLQPNIERILTILIHRNMINNPSYFISNNRTTNVTIYTDRMKLQLQELQLWRKLMKRLMEYFIFILFCMYNLECGIIVVNKHTNMCGKKGSEREIQYRNLK